MTPGLLVCDECGCELVLGQNPATSAEEWCCEECGWGWEK